MDLSHDPRPGQHDPAAPRAGEPSRFLGLWFSCAGQYARATKDPSGAAYVGHCPECGKQARFPIGPGGTDARTFTVSCR
ncbi:MAG: hypothetical protein C0513_07665 [Isosphaera sp.]|nr:hypothetical protein [Isosphaera sp.]